MTRWFAVLLSVILFSTGCSIKKMAINSLADSLAGGSDVYASDNDPELVGDALPFALKTIESLLVQVPNHKGLLVSAASGFTQYTYGFVWLNAQEIEYEHPAEARAIRERASHLYLRARDYGLRALELTQPGFRDLLEKEPDKAFANMKKEDVPALYWTGVSWGAAVTQAKGEMDLVADLPLIDHIMDAALKLDEGFQQGAIHEFFLTYEAGRSGGSLEVAKKHFDRAMELNGGSKIGPLVSYAETISVQTQNYKEFQEYLDRALNFDVDRYPANRLANLLAQKRARQLKKQAGDLFLEGEDQEEES